MSQKRKLLATDQKENIDLPPKRLKTDSKEMKNEEETKSQTYIHVFTDGSCDLTYSVCGSGVYFPHDEKRNISVSNIPKRQTNQRAELFAIYQALVATAEDPKVKIFTDSLYSINCIYKRYVAKKNLDILEDIESEWEKAKSNGFTRKFLYVRGHTGIQGNEKADKLAKKAMREKRAVIMEELHKSESEDSDD